MSKLVYKLGVNIQNGFNGSIVIRAGSFIYAGIASYQEEPIVVKLYHSSGVKVGAILKKEPKFNCIYGNARKIKRLARTIKRELKREWRSQEWN